MKPQKFIHRFVSVSFKILSILTIEMLVVLMENQVLDLRFSKPLRTLLGMSFAVLLFYFLISYIERITDWFLARVLSVSEAIRFRTTATVLIILGLYYLAYMAYYKSWFGVWPRFPL